MFSNELWQKSGVSTYSIDQSIRFNDDDSAYLKKDYGSDGSQTTFTLSGWLKLGILTGTAHSLFATGFLNGSAADFTLYFNGDQLYFYGGYNGGTPTNRLETTQLFRDHSAWYHIVFVADTTNAVSSERLRLYVNGSRVTAFDTETYPSQNDTLVWGDATYSHVIGASSDDIAGNLNSQTPRYHYDGYMAELVYIDGTAYGPENFGEYNDSNIWIPKDVSGLTFGTNGFHIDGRDSADLGDDESSNGNDFTTSGLASNDQVADSPTNNFAVYNILYNVGDVDFPTYSEGNLSVDFNYFGKRSPVSTFALPTDSDAYCEFYIKTSSASNNSGVGIGQGDANNSGNVVLTNGVTYNFNGKKTTGGSATTFGNTYTAGDIIGVYFDQSDNEVDFYKNNTLEGSLSLSHLSGDLFFLVANNTTAQQVIIANFGQDDTFAGNKTSGSAGSSDSSGNGKFYYSRISGAKALCSKSLGS